MFDEVLVVLKDLWAVAPDVAVNATLLFLAIGLLKKFRLLTEEKWIQFGSLFGAWLISGRVVPESFADSQEWYMTVVMASGMFQVYKWIRNNKGNILSALNRFKPTEVPVEDKYGK